MVELVGGGSVINRANPSCFFVCFEARKGIGGQSLPALHYRLSKRADFYGSKVQWGWWGGGRGMLITI